MLHNKKISVIIPVYNVGETIVDFLNKIPDYVDKIYLIDDCCPMSTGIIAQKSAYNSSKLSIIFNKKNLGVGGSVKIGYEKSLLYRSDIVVKIDGDNQMDPKEIKNLLMPIISGDCDYSKGNRFINKNEIENYPRARFYGNIFLSFMSKLSSGYWDIFDPINGFTAIKVDVLKKINIQNVDNRYFFESDMLFNLYLNNVKIKDIPVEIRYHKNQVQNLNVTKETFNFLFKNIHRTYLRIKKKYFMHNFSITSFFGFSSFSLFLFAFLYGGFYWIKYGVISNKLAPNGIVILSVSSLTLAFLFLGVFLYLDSLNNPNIQKNPND